MLKETLKQIERQAVEYEYSAEERKSAEVLARRKIDDGLEGEPERIALLCLKQAGR